MAGQVPSLAAARTLKDRVGRVGIFSTAFEWLPVGAGQEVACELEHLGFDAVWVTEQAADTFLSASFLLAATSRLVVGTGITNIWARTAYATTAAQGVLTRTFPGRFLLGLGSSHQPLVERVYRRRYEQPLAQMRQFLDGMDHAIALLDASQPEGTTASRVLAALGPKMLALAAQQADGAFPYLQTPDHTAMARQALGSDALLVVEQMAVVDESPSAARELARRHLSHYLPLPNYQANLARLGFGEDDLADGGSDRLVDALFAWGDVKAVASRVQEQRSAGADHVAVQVIMPSGRSPATQEWRELSGVLL